MRCCPQCLRSERPAQADATTCLGCGAKYPWVLGEVVGAAVEEINLCRKRGFGNIVRYDRSLLRDFMSDANKLNLDDPAVRATLFPVVKMMARCAYGDAQHLLRLAERLQSSAVDLDLLLARLR